MLVPLRSSRFRIDTCPFYHVEAVAVIVFFQNLVGFTGDTDTTATNDFRIVSIQFLDTVSVMSQVHFHTPVPVSGTDDIATDSQFNTLVFHFTHILPAGSYTGKTGYRYSKQNVGSILVVIIE